MSETKEPIERTDETEKKGRLGVSRPGKLELKKTVEAGQVRQSFSHGRSKAVTVEVRRKRTFAQNAEGRMAEVQGAPHGAEPAEPAPGRGEPEITVEEAPAEEERRAAVLRTLTSEERAARMRALQGARKAETVAVQVAEEAAQRARERERAAEEERRRIEEEEEARRAEEEARRKAEDEARRAEEEARRKMDEEAARSAEAQAARLEARTKAAAPEAAPAAATEEEEEAAERQRRAGRPEPKRPAARRGEPRRRTGRLTIAQALDEEERTRSLASVRRARERERRAQRSTMELGKVFREVVVPETITVQELANRMAERSVDVVKALMKMGVMVTATQTIDADTAELVVSEFGHRLKRVSEADVEIGLKGEEDPEELKQPRPPVVTVMGHVDHGKTSLLDALRKTDVVAREAGGITQHIGAYQVRRPEGQRITFVDTPGHEAFTAMRSRGAHVTDIVVLVVAADDGIMPQTVEAIDHAKAAGVPIIVAINKIDRADADPARVRSELLQHELVVEELGGDILAVEVSALKGTNLDKLEEAITLQAELLELRTNPDRPGEGVVIESRLDRGRGAMATLLVQRGTLRSGDIVVAGGEWGRVRAMFDDAGERVEEAGPSVPVEIIGLNGVPLAGEEFVVVDTEQRAREISAFRQRRERDARTAAGQRGTLEQMFQQIGAGQTGELNIVVKGDVQGSVEAITATAEKLGTDEVSVRILHSGVGGINESDVSLAKASGALIVGFNVRANPQARALAESEKVDIRYYAVIYDLIDDLKQMLSGMLAPARRENFLGNAQILEVFNITKVGKVAGCRITDGVVRRGAKVRLLRDNVVIHEGSLSTLKRFKDEVREVREGYECGMSFESYQDIRVGDVIECFEIQEVARTL